MSCLQFLRHRKSIARWVMAWFVLSLGVATAAPALQAQNVTLVCSASGQSKWVSVDASGVQQPGTVTPELHRHLDCLLCLGLGALPTHHNPVVLRVAAPSPTPAGDAPAFVAHTRTSPLSARGPPTPLQPT